MRFKKKVLLLPIIAAIVLVYFFFIHKSAAQTESYTFGAVTRGNLEIITSSTGTLQPVSLVEVGTQLSGRVENVFADYNSIVREGQILAILDTLQLAINYRSAQNDLARSRAQFELTSREYNDKVRLFERSFISELELLRAETDLKLAQTNLLNAESNLQRAELNLKDYAIIRSPINGIIIDKNVEEGQTVAASLSAPILFTIAADLENMEIQAQVDEIDIGMIKAGQPTRYTVDAFPGRTFTGTVRDVRLKPQIISNVVIYSVIISTKNPDGILMPGMTATIDFITRQLEDILLVPSAALRFRPSEEILQQMIRENMPDGLSGVNVATTRQNNPSSTRGGNMGMLWSQDSNGKLTMTRVRIGETDGMNTQVIPLEGEIEGMKIIVNRVVSGQTARTVQTQAPLGAPQRMRF